MVKIYNNNSDLCSSCKHAHIMENVKQERTVFCGASGIGRHAAIKTPVVSCTQYYLKTQPWQHEMEQIAWILTPDVKSGKIGFRRVKDMDNSERERLGIY